MRMDERLRKMGIEAKVVDYGYIPQRGERIVAVIRYPEWGWKSEEDIKREIEGLRSKYEFDQLVYRVSTRSGCSRVFLITKQTGSAASVARCRDEGRRWKPC